MIKEAVLDFDNTLGDEECTPPERRHRALREARAQYAMAPHASARFEEDSRGRRSLRKTHPDAHQHHVVAPRARHLRYNHFTRPARRRRMQDACFNSELLDGFSIVGGYDGTQIFLKLKIDASKRAISDTRDVVLKPLQYLSESKFFDGKDFFGSGYTVTSVFDNIETDVSFLASAHLGAMAGFELEGQEFEYVHSMTQTQLARRSFLQFADVSAKFSATANASGEMKIANVGSISIENAKLGLGFGLGIVETTQKIYFNEISSVTNLLARQAHWQNVGVLDVSIPVHDAIKFPQGIDLILYPIISITSSDLLSPDSISMSIDLNLE